MIQIPLNIKVEEDMIFFFCGYEKTAPGHAIGPSVRDYYILHIIHKGKGIVRTGDQEYLLKEGNGFILYPDAISYYAADRKEPWEYSWIAIKGKGMERILAKTNLSPHQNILHHHNFDFFKFFSIEHETTLDFDTPVVLTLKSNLYAFFAQLINLNVSLHERKEKDMDNVYIRAVENIIHTNFHNKITIEQIAAFVGFNISYLGEIFKEKKGISMKDYLTNVRIQRACELLINTHYSVKDIARSVGYMDQLQFSKMFKKHKSVSPTKYREENIL